jgi:hypothetical protein
MENTTRTWRICAVLLAVAIATSAATQPASHNVKAASISPSAVATLTVLITPPDPVPAHMLCHWTATPSGGTSPYHYAWTVNNSAVGTDAPALAYTNNGSGFRLQVVVTDATSAQAFDSKIITMGGTCF